MTPAQIKIVQFIGLSILETIAEASKEGEIGAPDGILYAACQTQGASLNQYQTIMFQLSGKGFVTKDDSDCYKITELGEGFIQKLKATLH